MCSCARPQLFAGFDIIPTLHAHAGLGRGYMNASALDLIYAVHAHQIP